MEPFPSRHSFSPRPAFQAKLQRRAPPDPWDNDSKSSDSDAFEPLSLEDVRDDKNANYDPNCFGCIWGFGTPSIPDDFPKMAQLAGCYYANWGKITDDALYQLISDKQKELFYEPFKDQPWDPRMKKPKPVKWTFEQVKDHFTIPHGTIYDMELKYDYKDFTQMTKFLSKHIGKKDEKTGKESVNLGVVKEYRAAMKQKQDMLAKIMSVQKQ